MSNEDSGKPLITINDITIRLRDRFLFAGTSWEINSGRHWAILGANGAGKSTLVRVLTGAVPHVRGSVVYHFPQNPGEAVGYVSSELQEGLIAAEEHRDMSRSFARNTEDIRKAGSVIIDGATEGRKVLSELDRIAGILGISHLLDRGMRYLSSGEMRKVVIARALIKSLRILILDEPFAGIDRKSRDKLVEAIGIMMQRGLQVVQVAHRVQEIMPLISDILLVKEGRVLLQGRRADVLTRENLEQLYGVKKFKGAAAYVRKKEGVSGKSSRRQEKLVEMKNVTVKYGDVTVLNSLTWQMRRGENWAVAGPNGSGKTTFLSLISGDNPQAYANEIYLFGRRRGSGESIWEIKSRIGAVSSELQTAYRKEITAYDVVASGLFDSVGLYRNLGASQKRQIDRWIEILGISDIAGRIFNRLSFGERRMVLLARSMVKSPEILILDEPCQGLDRENRMLLMKLIEAIGSRTDTSLLYVTHYQEEIPACTDYILSLHASEAKGYSISRYSAADSRHS